MSPVVSEFTEEEINLLNHGLQHSIEKPLKTYWTNLIMETERAIKLLDVKLQNPFRIIATKRLKFSSQATITMSHKKDKHTS